MKLFNTTLLGASLIALTACASMPVEAADKPMTEKSWSHSTPEKWGDASTDYKACKAGHMQSPIDLGASKVGVDFTVDAAYGAINGTAINKGYTVQVDFPAGQTMTSSGTTYNLAQFHLHTPSEHVISGKSYPLVSHFVHVGSDGALAVLGVMFEEGAANAELQNVIDALDGQKTGAVSLDTSKMLPDDMRVFRYMGSLTTPPCSEGVNWHVAHEPLTASAAQLDILSGMMGMNARPVQDLNNRLLIAPK